MENYGQGTHSTKMGAYKLTKIPQIPKLYAQAQNVWYFNEKSLHWASIVRVSDY